MNAIDYLRYQMAQLEESSAKCLQARNVFLLSALKGAKEQTNGNGDKSYMILISHSTGHRRERD